MVVWRRRSAWDKSTTHMEYGASTKASVPPTSELQRQWYISWYMKLWKQNSENTKGLKSTKSNEVSSISLNSWLQVPHPKPLPRLSHILTVRTQAGFCFFPHPPWPLQFPCAARALVCTCQKICFGLTRAQCQIQASENEGECEWAIRAKHFLGFNFSSVHDIHHLIFAENEATSEWRRRARSFVRLLNNPQNYFFLLVVWTVHHSFVFHTRARAQKKWCSRRWKIPAWLVLPACCQYFLENGTTFNGK